MMLRVPAGFRTVYGVWRSKDKDSGYSLARVPAPALGLGE